MIYDESCEELTITSCSFYYGETNMDNGGMIYIRTITITSFLNCSFENSESIYGNGGMIYVQRVGIVINSCTFTNSSSENNGGVLFLLTFLFIYFFCRDFVYKELWR
jgi:hypothetical protein